RRYPRADRQTRRRVSHSCAFGLCRCAAPFGPRRIERSQYTVMLQSSADITKLLGEIRRGNRNAESELAAVVHEELRLIAARLMRRERTNHTLQPTALVNEAYVRLLNAPDQDWKDRAHFFGVAAQIMRRILVDSARAYRAEKRNGNRTRLQLHD